ncbi:MAG: hypothetical protein IH859_00835 [Chloroflexi bacterium]|nr:hypothetical protein [Chloroflexota bacterium]
MVWPAPHVPAWEAQEIGASTGGSGTGVGRGRSPRYKFNSIGMTKISSMIADTIAIIMPRILSFLISSSGVGSSIGRFISVLSPLGG